MKSAVLSAVVCHNQKLVNAHSGDPPGLALIYKHDRNALMAMSRTCVSCAG